MLPDSNQKKGDLFEKSIVNLYEALNFHITRNIGINGQQVDIVAEKSVPGVGRIKTLIECKYLTTGTVSNQIIFDWASFINSIPKENSVLSGVIVSNQPFSKDAQTAAANSNITLLTQQQLESEVFQLKESYLRNVNDYENSDIYQMYLPLNGIDKSSLRFGREVTNVGLTITNKEYDDWNRTKFITVLADFGSGKTTLMQWLNYQYSKKYLEGNSIKPIYFELKYFFQFQDIDLLAVNTYRKLFQKDIPAELFWKSVANGEFLLLLDGFDEMSPQVDRQIRIRNFQLLSPLLLSRSNSIISCRSSYFISDDEFFRSVEEVNFTNKAPDLGIGKQRIERLIKKEKKTLELYKTLVHNYTDDIILSAESEKVNAKAVVIELAELSKAQIDEYLSKFDANFREKCAASWEEVRDFCYKIYDIKDLLKKPILISMVKDTMLVMGVHFKKNNEVYDPSSLYESYTSANLQRDYRKGLSRQFMSTTQRKLFSEEIAYLMFQNNTLEVTLEELNNLILAHSDILSRVINPTEKTELEYIVSDIVLCTFIKKTENSRFKFIHKSFMEFFVARKLKNLLLKNDPFILKQVPISQEILYFIGCYSTAEQQLYQLLLTEISTKGVFRRSQIYKRNLAIAFWLSKNEHSDLYINDVEIDEIKVAGQKLFDCKLTGLNLKNISMSEVLFKDCPVLKFKLSNSAIDYVTFQLSNLMLEFRGITGIKVSIVDCNDAQIFDEGSLFKGLSISNSNVRGTGSFNAENSNFSSANLSFSTITTHNFYKPNFNLTEYIIKNGDLVTIKEGEINNSLLTINAKELTLQNNRMTSSDLAFNGKAEISGNTWKMSSCKLSGNISCSSNQMGNVIFKQSSGLSTLFITGNKFDDCQFVGLTLSVKSMRLFFKNKFQGCKGIIFITDNDEELSTVEFLSNGIFKKFGLFFVNLKVNQEILSDNFLKDFERSVTNEYTLKIYLDNFKLFNKI